MESKKALYKKILGKFLIIGLLAGAALFLFNKSLFHKSQLSPKVEGSVNTNGHFEDSNILLENQQAFNKQEMQSGIAPVQALAADAVVSFSDYQDLSSQEKAQLSLVQEVLNSKNDNDPRMDAQLRDISSGLKRALENEYERLAPEKKNERGTLVFLISREIKSLEDVDFLKKIYEEEPCLSLEDCKQFPKGRDPHHAGTEEVTLNYQQLVALFQIEKQLAAGSANLHDPRMIQEIKNALEKAKNYGVPRVRNKAQEIIEKFSL